MVKIAHWVAKFYTVGSEVESFCTYVMLPDRSVRGSESGEIILHFCLERKNTLSRRVQQRGEGGRKGPREGGLRGNREVGLSKQGRNTNRTVECKKDAKNAKNRKGSPAAIKSFKYIARALRVHLTAI